MPRSKIITITAATSLSIACGGLLGSEPDLGNPPAIQLTDTLHQDLDGTCTLTPEVECSPSADAPDCPPPEPAVVDCPPLADAKKITRLDDGTCQLEGSFDCPITWRCPSQAALPIDCPPQLGDADRIAAHYPYGCEVTRGEVTSLTADCPEDLARPLDPNYEIFRQSDGRCFADPGAPDCPEGAFCNPPAPIEVPCPPEEIEPDDEPSPPTPG